MKQKHTVIGCVNHGWPDKTNELFHGSTRYECIEFIKNRFNELKQTYTSIDIKHEIDLDGYHYNCWEHCACFRGETKIYAEELK